MAARQFMAGKDRPAADNGKLGRELLGLLAVFCGLLIILSLATFDSRDPWLNHVVGGSGGLHNRAGLFGAYLAGFLYDMIGFAAWVVPAFFCLNGARRIVSLREWAWWRWTGFMLLALCLSLAGAARDLDPGVFFTPAALPPGSGNVSAHGGGIVGHMLYTAMAGWLGPTGSLMLWLFFLLLAVQMITGISWLALLTSSGLRLRAFVLSLADQAGRGAGKARIRPVPARPLPDETARPRLLAPPDAPPDVPPDVPDGAQSDASRAGALRNNEAILYPDERDSGPERPELFRQSPAADDPAILQGALQFSEALSPRADKDPFSPAGADLSEVPALELGPSALQGRPGEEEEEDLPPWVRDFEEDRLGVEAVPPLAGSFQMPAPPPVLLSAPLSMTLAAPAGPVILQDDLAAELYASAPFPEKQGGAALPAGDQAEVPDPPPVPGESGPSGAGANAALSGSESGPGEEEEKEAGALPLPDETEEDAPEKKYAAGAGQAGSIRIAGPSPVPMAATGGSNSASDPDFAPLKSKERIPLPPLELLEAAPAAAGGMPRGLLEIKGRSLMTCLNDFGIQGELVGITPGPVVTMFEFRPAPGVRVSRIANLSDDLALALKAVAVRIQAPVPGTDTVGIEIPNEARETVRLKELLGSRLFREASSLLTLALGKDIAGGAAVADLAAMPHLLVAGATGAGKSVGINSIILSLICKARPDEVKLLLVDPKRVEMAVYADLPHLVHPVVTEMALAKNALEWAVAEMERRYNAIARAGVRNIADYNAKVSAFGASPPTGLEDLEVIPYLVVIIDELADLMLVAAKEVEISIVRLAQLARAAGIHLILATQRPSVDVVTGLIKANFPCRIAFQVTSKHDSRTILDTVGAEHLLGKGDMLFKPGGGKFRRLHGAFVSDSDVNAVVDYWRSRQIPDYQVDFSEWSQENGGGLLAGEGGGGGDVASDPVYNEAVEFVRQQGKASISLIQRKFRIGFNRAARFVEQMERDGIIGPADGSRPRLVIRQ